jgi:hypothetical protein
MWCTRLHRMLNKGATVIRLHPQKLQQGWRYQSVLVLIPSDYQDKLMTLLISTPLYHIQCQLWAIADPEDGDSDGP